MHAPSTAGTDATPGPWTFLFSDIEGSTRLLTRLGDAFEAVHADHQRLLRTAWREHGGREVSTEGDSFFVVFDTASSALRAAAAAHRALARHRWPADAVIRVRIGIHTGRAIRVRDDYLGLDVNRAARIAAAGHGGQTLASEATRDAAPDLAADLELRDLGRHRLKDVGVLRLWQLDAADLPSEFGRLRTLEAHPTNLPGGLSVLVDREDEAADIRARLRDCQVVTLTGPGGIGKSRVAVRVARDLVEAYPDGVFYLDVAAVDTADAVADRLLETLELAAEPGVPPSDAVVRLLVGRAVLLLLDNADRTAGLAGLVADIARACHGARLLVTSRAPLRLSAEREVAIGPLGLPGPARAGDLVAIGDSPAASLFVMRAREVTPGFEVTATNAAAIADICARLDGLPLAIELAAARTRVLPVAALRDRLARRLPLLAGGARDAPDRQRTMRDAIAWSYDLLDEGDRLLLDRLAVFEGPFGLEAAEAVGASVPAGSGSPATAPIPDPGVLDRLESLVERSLVARVDDGDAPAFRLLGTIREFALDRLEAGAEADDARDRHLRHWLGFVREQTARTDVDDLEISERVERHAAEYTAALERAVGGDAPSPDLAADGLALAAMLGRHWWLHGHVREGAAWLERALDATGGTLGAAAGSPATADALYWAGVLAEVAGDDERAQWRLLEALARYTADDDRRSVARVLNSLGVAARSRDDLDTAQDLLGRALAIHRELGDERGLAITLNNLGIVEVDRGRYESALALLEDAVALDRAAGKRIGAAYSNLAYGSALAGTGRLTEAVDAVAGSLATFAELADPEGVADGLDELAGIILRQGEPATAMRLFLAADTLRDRAGVRLREVDRRRRDPVIAEARALVDRETLEHLATESTAVDIGAALAIARAAAMR